MMAEKKIQGFLHYRTDLGDGVRTGVVFSDCTEPCSHVCSSFSFIPDHGFCGDTPEKNEYTSTELAKYLKEEKAMYYAKKLGITFLGREPLRDPFFCAEVAKELKENGIDLQIFTCGMCSTVAFEYLDGLVEKYVLRIFLPLEERMKRIVDFLETRETPYRIQLPVSESDSLSQAESFAEYALRLHSLKSVWIHFAAPGISDERQKAFRRIFLDRKIPLY